MYVLFVVCYYRLSTYCPFRPALRDHLRWVFNQVKLIILCHAIAWERRMSIGFAFEDDRKTTPTFCPKGAPAYMNYLK